MTQLPITGGFYQSDSLPVSAQQLINGYVQIPETESAWSEEVIFGTPGLVQRASTGSTFSDQNRGALTMAGVPYFVNGNALYSVSDDQLTTNLGVVGGLESQRVSMAQNGTQLIIVVPDTGLGYIWNHDTAMFDIITDVNFTTTNGVPRYVDFDDSYFIVSTDDTKKFKISNVNDGLTWSALDFGSAEGNPDDTVAPKSFKDRLYIFGTDTFEAFRNIGGADFPFQSIQGGLQNIGLTAPFSLVDGRDFFYFIGSGEGERVAVWKTDGQAPQRASTAAIEGALQSLSDDEISDIYAVSYAENGAYWVGFHLPGTSFYFNEVNGRWQERQSESDANILGWRVSSIVEAYGRLYVGDTQSGIIGTIENSVYTEYGNDILRTLVTAPFAIEQNVFFLPQMELTMEGGTADEADAPEPKIRLSISSDGGRSFTEPRIRSLGRVGDVRRRIIWNRNGRFPKTAVLKFQFSSPTKFVIVRLDVLLVPGVPRFAA